MKQSELDAEVWGLIEKRLEAGLPTPQGWLVQEIVGRYPDVDGDDVDMYLLCAVGHVTATARRVLRPYTAEDETPGQDPLPGFARIQRGYMVERDGDRVLVKTQHLTPSELRAKAKEYRALGQGCAEHADELERLADDREAESAAR